VVETALAKMKIVITGADGQLGKSLRDALIKSPHEVTALNRSSLDITNFDNTLQIITELNPDWIVNCAAYTNVDQAEIERDECTAVNTTGVANLIATASKTKSKLIQISTDYVFDGNKDDFWQENDKRSPISHYGKSKADAESLILSDYFSQSVIIRTSWLYSKYGKNFAKTMINLGKNGASELNVVSDQVGQPTSCVDLSHLILDVIDGDLKGLILHGTNSGSASWYQFARTIFEFLGFDVARVKPTLSEKYPQKAERPKNSVLGHQCFADIGFKPMRNWEIALKSEVLDIFEAVERKGLKE